MSTKERGSTVAKRWFKSTAIWSARVLLSLVILFALLMGFGTSASDAEKLRIFGEAVEKWQHNPDFRQVQIEYVELGSNAMRTRAAFVNATKGVLWLRSLPGLPKDWAVNDTSLAHYTSFTKGPLSAYLHLCGEQGMADSLKMLKDLGQKSQPTDDDVREFLSQYKLYYPVVKDDGAVQSVRSLLQDVDPGRGFADMNNITEAIKPHIGAIAAEHGYSSDVAQMTAAQQREVWAVLDDTIHERDYELWRLKQVNDWLNGLWAQVYGRMYAVVIGPTLTLREAGRIAGPVLLMAWVGLGLWLRKRHLHADAPGPVPPRLALEGGKDLSDV